MMPQIVHQIIFSYIFFSYEFVSIFISFECKLYKNTKKIEIQIRRKLA